MMKKTILLPLTLMCLFACRKEESPLPKVTPTLSIASVMAKSDTIPDEAVFKIKLVKDSVNSDETALVFNHTASLAYSTAKDVIYFPGFGQVSLSSISSDGRQLAINYVPYTPGMSICLNVHTKTDSKFFLETSYENNIPANIQIWIKDNYLKDSIDSRSGNYNFNVSKADTNSFSSKRFKLIIKDSGV